MSTTEQLCIWYVSEKRPMAEIERLSGLTRQGVWKRLRLAGLLSEEAKRRVPPVVVTCAECGVACTAARWKTRVQRRHFCGDACYRHWLRNPDYHESRQGQRRARAVAREFFPLQEWHIVHHVDTDTENNDPRNLMVFASAGEHMAWHQLNPSVVPLWRGDGKEVAVPVGLVTGRAV